MPRLMIAASGTGGHLFPAIALADSLSSDWEISWLGVPDRLETKLVPLSYALETVKAGGLQGKGIKKIIQLLQLLYATRRVLALMKKKKIDIVFSTGGYIAAPAILAAFFYRIPVVLHESNIVPGRVVRLLGRLCKFVAVGWHPTVQRLYKCNSVVTGTPVRSSFLSSQALPAWVPLGSGPLLVVMGGSQGSVPLNRMVRAVFPELLQKGCRIVHLTGQNDPDANQIRHPNLIEKPFSDEIPALLQNADLVISRAGAGTINELAVSGTPAVLVPYPFATDQHQELNAAFAAEHAAAVIVHQHQPEHYVLGDTLNRLLENRIQSDNSLNDPLFKMMQGMEKIAKGCPQKSLLKLLNECLR